MKALVALALLSMTPRVLAAPPRIVEHSFLAGQDGDGPEGPLSSYDGTLYGTTVTGGTAGNGTVFGVTLRSTGPHNGTATENVLWRFSGPDGSAPMGGLLGGQDPGGDLLLYGTTALDGPNRHGTVWVLTVTPQESRITTLWGFSGRRDGGQPLGALVADQSGSGVLYGTTRLGGADNLGVVFSLTPPQGKGAWTETVLYSFTGPDGQYPVASLTQDRAGVLYGTTTLGGASSAGTVFSLTPPSNGQAWTETVLYSFTGGPDGATPASTLLLDPSTGVLTGTAEYGGELNCPEASYPYYQESATVTAPTLAAPYVPVGGNGCGVVFSLVPSTGQAWTATVLWSFTGGPDGDNPVSEPTAFGGLWYGTVPLTSAGLKGVMYRLTPDGSGAFHASAVETFKNERQGSYPRAAVVPGPEGRLFGTNAFGGSTWVHTKVYGYGALYGVLP